MIAFVLLRPSPHARHDRRASLRVAGVWLVIACAIGLVVFAINRPAGWTAEECLRLARVPLLLSIAGVLLVIVIGILDGVAEDRFERTGPPPHLDVGGSWWLTHVGTPQPIARGGDLERARGLLAASQQSRIAIALVLLAVAPTLFVYARFAVE
jgi:hypothetical protein